MYLPPYFAEDDQEILYSVIRENNFGLLVTTTDGAPLASHLPFLLEGDTLVAHMARANPQWEAFESGAEVLCVFHGPHGYVSPNWYANKKSVPTWNYVAVHVYGAPRIVDDPAVALAMQERLVAAHEAGSPTPWTMVKRHGRPALPVTSCAVRAGTKQCSPSPSSWRARGARVSTTVIPSRPMKMSPTSVW